MKTSVFHKRPLAFSILGGALGFILLAFVTDWPLPSLIVALVLGLLLHRYLNRKQPADETVPAASPERLAHYRSLGMSNADIRFFRSTMQTAAQQIKQLETNMAAAPKLKAIELHDEPVKVSQATFKALVQTPQKLTLAADFLYRHLPRLVQLSHDYLAISQHTVKDKDTYTVLSESAALMTDLAQTLKADYQQIVADDQADLAINMQLAREELAKANAEKESPDNDRN